MTIRPASEADVPRMVELIGASRQKLAEWQPVFWRPSPQAPELTATWFSVLVRDENAITLVSDDQGVNGFAIGLIQDGPPVYAPGGKTCLVDDFAIADNEDWESIGSELLKEMRIAAADHGAVQCVVVSPKADAQKQICLETAGLTAASIWWTGPTAVEDDR